MTLSANRDDCDEPPNKISAARQIYKIIYILGHEVAWFLYSCQSSEYEAAHQFSSKSNISYKTPVDARRAWFKGTEPHCY